MSNVIVRSISTGLSQKGVRDHNERLLLSLLQRHGSLPASDLSRLAGLSPPTISGILRRLEADGLLERGEPVRGKVGKPSLPMHLSPDGALSWGLKIGRRSSNLLLMDLTGVVRHQRILTYAAPRPTTVFTFLRDGLRDITKDLRADQVARICGIGVAAPFELWNGECPTDSSTDGLNEWRAIDLRDRIAAIAQLPTVLANDGTAGCQAEQVYGRGKEFRDYAYFFVGAYVGGGIVLNNSVVEGRQGNAGALGSLRTVGHDGESRQLVDTASIHLLERRLHEADLDPAILWKQPQDWSGLSRYVDPWLGQIAQEMARACLSTCAVIDFEAILIDGAFPASIRSDLVERVRRYLSNQDMRGLIAPRIEAGTIGANARALGAASGPIFAQFLLNTNASMEVA